MASRGTPAIVAIVAVLLLAVALPPVGGADAAQGDGTRVDSMSADRSGAAVQVAGTATFVDVPVTVGTQDVGTTLVPGVGTDLVEATIARPDPFGDDLVFTIAVADMPDDVWGIPEATCYQVHGATLAGGDLEATWMVQGFRTKQAAAPGSLEPVFLLNLPLSHPDYPDHPLLSGRMEDGVVEFALPMSLAEAAPGMSFIPRHLSSTPIEAGVGPTGGSGLSCHFGNPSIEFDSLDWDEYVIPDATVRLGIAPAGTPPSAIPTTTTASVATDGSFAGGISLDGRPPGSYVVLARACYGASSCGEATTTITI